MAEWLETVKLHAATQVAATGQARHALVTSVDPVAHAVKVSIQPEGIESGWIPDGTLAAATGLRIACPTEIGSQVLVIPVEGDAEHPVLVAKVFDVTIAPPKSPATGKTVQAGEIGLFLGNGNYVHLTDDGIYIRGTVYIDGNLSISGDAVASGVSVVSHVHTGVETGDSTTGAPRKSDG